MASERIDVTYRVVTPLFCGGAGGDTAEVRLPSFKGVLRWWWRALAWSQLGGDLGEVCRDENALFGSAGGGQSKVSMRLIPSTAPKWIDSGKHLRIDGTIDGKIVEEGARYLGYGVMGAFGKDAGKLTRACLMAPFELKLELRVRDLDRTKLERLLDALRAVGLLGGFGAKSRRGYGSLVLRSMSVGGRSEWSPPESATTLKDAIAKLLPADFRRRTLPLYTALSPRARVVLLSASGRSKPLELLNLIGREMMRYRSWGHDGLVLAKPREENFKDDHDLMKQHARQRTKHPRRIAFGLPHNYGKNLEDKVRPADAKNGDRRASPLIIHVHECGETPVAVLSFLPAIFLPGGDSAEIDVGDKIVTIARDPELWKPIDELLNRFLSSDPKVRKEPLGTALEVRP
jgi:CRISPR-associated protein Cmr1